VFKKSNSHAFQFPVSDVEKIQDDADSLSVLLSTFPILKKNKYHIEWIFYYYMELIVK